METLFTKLFEIFSLEYMFTVIIASYLFIKLVDAINGVKAVPTWQKRTITFVVGAASFFVFKQYTDVTMQCLIASYFAAVFVYDTAIKVIIKKFDLDYKK
jgi:uncharacterized membrane protein